MFVRWWLVAVGIGLLVACTAPREFTATVHEDPNWVIRLQKNPGANRGRGYSHPASLNPSLMEKILAGVVIRLENAEGGEKVVPVFSEFERKHLAALLTRGLQNAGRFELVTFVQVIPATSWQERVTSGGVFVEDGRLHFLLANLQVKQARWQDIEQYQAPVENVPLEPLEKLPKTITFLPKTVLVETGVAAEDFHRTFGLSPWHIAIQYKKL